MIVSVSRRCDIPRFQFDWFMERVGEGFVEVANPYNAGQIKRVSLLPAREDPDGVDLFAFWTRDPRHILSNAENLLERGFIFYVMVTVTGYPAVLEPDMAPAQEVLSAMKELSQKLGADSVIWRYDPILLSSITDEDFHRRNFSELAQSLAGSVKRVIISLYDEYHGAKLRLLELERKGRLKMPNTPGDVSALLADMAKTAEAAGMEIQTCAEEKDFSSFGIKPGACIDAVLVNKLCGLKLKTRDKNQRPNCLCCKSTDIGVYGVCEARCEYCYAWR